MLPLTKQEQQVLAFVFLLLLTGLAVKTYRTSRPTEAPAPATETKKNATG